MSKNFKIREVSIGVYLIESSTKYLISSMFMRPQEYYESSFKEIRGKYFTVESFMDIYAESRGEFSYSSDWSGFNLPSHIFKEFYEVFKDDLTKKELLLLQLVKSINPNLEGDFYIIGMSNDSLYKRSILLHELAHAYWYMNDGYREGMMSLIKVLPLSFVKKVRKSLMLMGYDKSVVDDEIQAYFSTSTKDDIKLYLSWWIDYDDEIVKPFRRFNKKFAKFHKIPDNRS